MKATGKYCRIQQKSGQLKIKARDFRSHHFLLSLVLYYCEHLKMYQKHKHSELKMKLVHNFNSVSRSFSYIRMYIF